jgi:hypothetical protein
MITPLESLLKGSGLSLQRLGKLRAHAGADAMIPHAARDGKGPYRAIDNVTGEIIVAP